MQRPNLHRVPELTFDPDAWRKMRTYVQLAPGEVNGWAYVSQIGNSGLYVASEKDVFITDQVVTSGSADVTSATNGQASYQAVLAGRANDLRLQWHSHVWGSPIFSETDTDTMDRYENAGAAWMLSVVLNKFGQVTARLDSYALRMSMDLPVYVADPVDDELVTACAGDMLEHLTHRTYPAPKGRRHHANTDEEYQLAKPIDRPLREHDLKYDDVRYQSRTLLSKLS